MSFIIGITFDGGNGKSIPHFLSLTEWHVSKLQEQCVHHALITPYSIHKTWYLMKWFIHVQLHV